MEPREFGGYKQYNPQSDPCGYSTPIQAEQERHRFEGAAKSCCGSGEPVQVPVIVRELHARQRQLEVQKEQIGKQLQIVRDLLSVFGG